MQVAPVVNQWHVTMMSENNPGNSATRNASAFKWAVVIFAIVEAVVIAGAIYLALSR
jgi:hypothetical protein